MAQFMKTHPLVDSSGFFLGRFIAGSSKNLIFALWMDPMGKTWVWLGVCEFDGV